MTLSPYTNVQRATAVKLNVTPRAVGLRREKIQRIVGMPNDIALYIVAQRASVPIHKWVKDPEVLAQVASFEARVAAKEGGTAASPQEARTSKTPRPPGKVAQRAGTEFVLDKITVPAGVLSERHLRDAKQMAGKVYPLLYAFENSAREFIDGHLSSVYGEDWWNDAKLVSKTVRDGVEIRRKADDENRTHSGRTARPIYYTTFGDLVLIVQSEKGGKVFKRPLFPRPTWFPELVKASEHTRNIVAHMNPLKSQDVVRLEVDFKDWMNQVKGHLPPSVP